MKIKDRRKRGSSSLTTPFMFKDPDTAISLKKKKKDDLIKK